jgi:hypothetical protein
LLFISPLANPSTILSYCIRFVPGSNNPDEIFKYAISSIPPEENDGANIISLELLENDGANIISLETVENLVGDSPEEASNTSENWLIALSTDKIKLLPSSYHVISIKQCGCVCLPNKQSSKGGGDGGGENGGEVISDKTLFSFKSLKSVIKLGSFVKLV